ncbi:MAG: MATE family efflux transporter [Melioribacteraceae bacterium]|nr:MATE family efflux transporter [Melioribacteraceae bacterium]
MTENNKLIYKSILKIALPAIGGLTTQMIVSLVDAAMVGRVPDATYALAAMGIGVLATWAIISFFSSLATGTHVLIARKFGENDFKNCGKVLNTSLINSIIIGSIVGLSFILFAYDISSFFAADDYVSVLAGDYLYYRFMGVPFFLMSVSYRGFFFGIKKTKIFLYSGLLTNFLNVIFNYIFIFGAFGVEPMGLAGAGLGSTLATMFDALFYIVITLLNSYRNKYEYFRGINFDYLFLKQIYKISLPVSFQNIFILVGFLSFVAITGLIGTPQQAASQATISSIFISLLPTFGFGIAVQTLVGNSLGAGNIKEAKMLALKTSILATLFTAFVGLFFIFTPDLVLLLITTEESVINNASLPLRIAGIAQIIYASGVVLANALQAAGKTFFVMMTEVIINWIIFVPLAYLLGIVLDFGLTGAWAAMPFYVLLYTTVIFIKFRFGNWKKYKLPS